MTIVLYILCLVTFVLLLLVSAVRVHRSELSHFELKRRADSGDPLGRQILARELILHDLLSLQRAVQAILLVTVAILAIASAGWLAGTIVALVIALFHGVLARWSVLQHMSKRLYVPHELKLLLFINRHPKLFSILRSVTREQPADTVVHSRDELLAAVQSPGVLTRNERLLVEYGLQFGGFTASDVMTPVEDIISVKKSELLGPLVLDDLHKTGHARFPVISGDIHHVVGVLSIVDMLTANSGKHSSTAEKAMDPSVRYARNDDSLEHVLGTLLHAHHTMLVVVNSDAETLGLLTLSDVLSALFGRQLHSGDMATDVRIVAEK